MDIGGTLIGLSIFLIPIASFIWLIVSIIFFVRTPRENTKKRSHWKLQLIISAVIFGLLLLLIAGAFALFAMSLTYM